MGDANTTIKRVLLVEDDKAFALLVSHHLLRAFDDVEIVHVERLNQCRQALSEGTFSAILLDLNLPDSTGEDTLNAVLSACRRSPIVVLTGLEDESFAMEALRTGAQDYVLKDAIDHSTLIRSVRFAMERSLRLQVDVELSQALGELNAAREAQSRLFPKSAPVISGFDIAGATIPADFAGGDYFDYLTLPDGRLLTLVGDVSGHGLSAALLMVEVRARLQTLANYTSDISKMFAYLENQLSSDTESMHFLTMFGLVLAPEDGTYEFISAGHVGYHLSANGEIRELQLENALLGFNLNKTFEKSTMQQLSPGDLLFIPTDGLQESFNERGEMLGETQLLEIVANARSQSASEIIAAAESAATEFRGEVAKKDDITAVVIKRF